MLAFCPLSEIVIVATAYLEDPSPDLTGAQGVNLTPDAIVRVRFSPERNVIPRLLSRTEHVQAAILVRQLRGELSDQPETTLITGGVGENVSGVLVPSWDADDRVKFASNFGWGIGRYITDLGTLGGRTRSTTRSGTSSVRWECPRATLATSACCGPPSPPR